jgi:cyclohexyl-isocyanide hydratase
LQQFGATPVNERVVIDRNLVTTAGVTAGFDGALRVTALLCGEAVAQEIQLYIQYAPEPPFNCGDPSTATSEILRSSREKIQPVISERQQIIDRINNRG